jgi:hypothetical protein
MVAFAQELIATATAHQLVAIFHEPGRGVSRPDSECDDCADQYQLHAAKKKLTMAQS